MLADGVIRQNVSCSPSTVKALRDDDDDSRRMAYGFSRHTGYFTAPTGDGEEIAFLFHGGCGHYSSPVGYPQTLIVHSRLVRAPLYGRCLSPPEPPSF